MDKKYGNINDYIKDELNGDSGRLIHDIMEAKEIEKNLRKNDKKKNNKKYSKIKKLIIKIYNKLSNLL